MDLISYIRATFELTKWFILAALLIYVLHSFVITVYIVSGESMVPNLNNGDFVLVDKVKYDFVDPQRGDVVVVRYPGDPENKYYVKRIIGLPGETVKVSGGNVYIDDQLLEERYLDEQVKTEPDSVYNIPPSEYFTVGDNRSVSSDSRVWGSAERRFIMGRVEATFWPLLQAFPNPIY